MVITGLYIYSFILGLVLTGILFWMDSASATAKFSEASLKRARSFGVFVLVVIIIWLCYLNFALTLTLLVLFMGLIALFDILFLRRKRTENGKPQPVIIEYSRSFFWVLFIVWVIRSFIVQPNRVPTGSLEPTVMPGDFLAVNQFAYGLRFPVLNLTMVPIGRPKTGDIVCFFNPPNPSMILVKRVIGTPGDHVVYKNKVLYINGKEMKQEDLGSDIDVEPKFGPVPEQKVAVERKMEDLNGVKHEIYVAKTGGLTGDYDVVVPPNMYFMMGDNRDNSDDSRMWGFAPYRNLIGKAFLIWLSWDPINHRIRWERIGKTL
jgi:signal peptidase I